MHTTSNSLPNGLAKPNATPKMIDDHKHRAHTRRAGAKRASACLPIDEKKLAERDEQYQKDYREGYQNKAKSDPKKIAIDGGINYGARLSKITMDERFHTLKKTIKTAYRHLGRFYKDHTENIAEIFKSHVLRHTRRNRLSADDFTNTAVDNLNHSTSTNSSSSSHSLRKRKHDALSSSPVSSTTLAVSAMQMNKQEKQPKMVAANVGMLMPPLTAFFPQPPAAAFLAATAAIAAANYYAAMFYYAQRPALTAVSNSSNLDARDMTAVRALLSLSTGSWSQAASPSSTTPDTDDSNQPDKKRRKQT